jgi:hypothetical protein
MEFPRLYRVQQNLPQRAIKDIPATIHQELKNKGFGTNLAPGSKIGIGVGSRGIHNIAIIVKSVVDYWKSLGMNPFLFPAMGSHGAATAEGQASVLDHYGINAETMGCPLISQLEVVSLGKTAEGLEAFMDKLAFESDGVMLIGRIKWHTDFSGGIESGLFKMMAIGLGKFAGAHVYHTHAYKMGLETVIRSVGRQVLKSGKILGGLAILEDGNHDTAQLTAVPVGNMEAEEEKLLALVKSWMSRVPGEHVDILVVNEAGKNFSGAGMDTKVINRGIDGSRNPYDTAPIIERLYLRDISDLSYGNAVGVGLADIIHERMVSKIDWHATRLNSLTASTPTAIRLPIHFPSDQENLKAIGRTVGKFSLKELNIVWVRNSIEVTEAMMSEPMLDQIQRNAQLEILEGPLDMAFTESGDLVEAWAPATAHH